MSEHTSSYFTALGELSRKVDLHTVDAIAAAIGEIRDRRGRLFILGVGGGAANASHAVNDFRKLCHVEAYAPTDNVAELTARTNDEGWETTFSAWLQVSQLCEKDGLLVFSVGGGSREHGISMNLVRAIELAHAAGAPIFGVVGDPNGATAQLADIAVLVRTPAELQTPLVESMQAVIWHALVSHPVLAIAPAKWESVRGPGMP